MSPVLQTEQRLYRLRELRARIDREIRDLEAAQMRRALTAATRPRDRRRKGGDDRVSQQLDRLGVSAYDVKVWAHRMGLVPAVSRGRIAGYLVDEYEKAHR